MARVRFASLALFATSFLASLVLLQAANAHAAWRRQVAAGTCRIIGGTGTPVYNGPEIQNSYDGGWNYMEIVCPVVDHQNQLQKQNVTELTVAVTSANSNLAVKASVCIAYETSTGGECGAASSESAGFTGEFDISDLTEWSSSHANDFGYLLVLLPGKYSGTQSGFRGFYAHSS